MDNSAASTATTLVISIKNYRAKPRAFPVTPTRRGTSGCSAQQIEAPASARKVTLLGNIFAVEFDWLHLAALQATTAEVAGPARCGILDALPRRCLPPASKTNSALWSQFVSPSCDWAGVRTMYSNLRSSFVTSVHSRAPILACLAPFIATSLHRKKTHGARSRWLHMQGSE